MLKRDEERNPASCYNKANDDEMVFVLLGRDAAAPAGIETWIRERVRLGLNKWGDAQLLEAEQAIQDGWGLSSGTYRQDEFDQSVGRLDHILSVMMGYGRNRHCLDVANCQTLKHHAEDMVACGNRLLEMLERVESTPQPPPRPDAKKPPPLTIDQFLNAEHVKTEGSVATMRPKRVASNEEMEAADAFREGYLKGVDAAYAKVAERDREADRRESLRHSIPPASKRSPLWVPADEEPSATIQFGKVPELEPFTVEVTSADEPLQEACQRLYEKLKDQCGELDDLTEFVTWLDVRYEEVFDLLCKWQAEGHRVFGAGGMLPGYLNLGQNVRDGMARLAADYTNVKGYYELELKRRQTLETQVRELDEHHALAEKRCVELRQENEGLLKSIDERDQYLMRMHSLLPEEAKACCGSAMDAVLTYVMAAVDRESKLPGDRTAPLYEQYLTARESSDMAHERVKRVEGERAKLHNHLYSIARALGMATTGPMPMSPEAVERQVQDVVLERQEALDKVERLTDELGHTRKHSVCLTHVAGVLGMETPYTNPESVVGFARGFAMAGQALKERVEHLQEVIRNYEVNCARLSASHREMESKLHRQEGRCAELQRTVEALQGRY